MEHFEIGQGPEIDMRWSRGREGCSLSRGMAWEGVAFEGLFVSSTKCKRQVERGSRRGFKMRKTWAQVTLEKALEERGLSSLSTLHN